MLQISFSSTFLLKNYIFFGLIAVSNLIQKLQFQLLTAYFSINHSYAYNSTRKYKRIQYETDSINRKYSLGNFRKYAVYLYTREYEIRSHVNKRHEKIFLLSISLVRNKNYMSWRLSFVYFSSFYLLSHKIGP